ncbi:tetratricopeptide repeat protein, partial [Psychrobacter urativorans]|uniref:tetratricopeptide repeat protein n=1 Tax=Psychrobacter urativorans TaxID=45610 RepID=UPI003BB7CCF6
YGVLENDAVAVDWFQKAASQGLPEAQYNLGRMYDYGYGINQDKIIAKEWYSKACNNGLQESCNK